MRARARRTSPRTTAPPVRMPDGWVTHGPRWASASPSSICSRAGAALAPRDLAVLDRSWENFLATKVLLAAGGVFFARSCRGGLDDRFSRSPIIPVWLALLFGVVLLLPPDLEVRRTRRQTA